MGWDGLLRTLFHVLSGAVGGTRSMPQPSTLAVGRATLPASEPFVRVPAIGPPHRERKEQPGRVLPQHGAVRQGGAAVPRGGRV